MLFACEMSDHLYNPINNLTQAELMEKFNLAFYEAQNLSKNDVLTTLQDEEESEDYLVNYFLGESEFTGAASPPTPPPSSITKSDFDDFINCDNFQNEDFDLDEISSSFESFQDNFEFNNFLREIPSNDLSYNSFSNQKSEFGHLLDESYSSSNNNLILSNQEDPLLSSSSLLFKLDEVQTATPTNNLQLVCKWENCYETYPSQSTLVRHIEKNHVEVKKGEEFTCFWEDCPRKVKPFNARYKLLIHMRVHSGEKPNKCPFKGCNKAFSRLENLKIHQRSHTGERPYLCQFSTCPKSFSNSSDRAKHQRTHFDTKPYACQVTGCSKKYTDPSSLRKHVKNHSAAEQLQIKKKSGEEIVYINPILAQKYFDPSKQKAIKSQTIEHNYSNRQTEQVPPKKYDSRNIKLDLKNKISEKNKLKNIIT